MAGDGRLPGDSARKKGITEHIENRVPESPVERATGKRPGRRRSRVGFSEVIERTPCVVGDLRFLTVALKALYLKKQKKKKIYRSGARLRHLVLWSRALLGTTKRSPEQNAPPNVHSRRWRPERLTRAPRRPPPAPLKTLVRSG